MYPVHLRPELHALALRILDLPLVLVSAPAGSGKSTLLSAWRGELEEQGTATAWIDLAPLHADPAAFLSEFAREIDRTAEREGTSDAFGASLLRRIPLLDAPDVHLLARLLADELRELGEPVPIFLDNYHRLPKGSPTDRILSQALRDGLPELHLVVATRGAMPGAATRLLVEGRALEVQGDDLSLHADQLIAIGADRGVDLDESFAARLLAQTRGWATGVLLAIRAIAEGQAGDTTRFVSELRSHGEVFSYVASELLADEPPEVLQLLEGAALLGSARPSELEAFCEGGADRIDEALDRGLLLRAGSRVGLHPMWESLLRERLRRRLDADTLTLQIERAVATLERADESDRAMELCIELDQRTLGLRLLERHGVDWVERGLHDNVSRWLDALAPPGEDSLDLALVRALLDGRNDAARAVDALEAVADRFRERGAYDREVVARHNAIILAANQGLQDRARRAAMRAMGLRRLIASPEARAAARIFLALGAALNGRFGIARRLFERATNHEYSPRERGALMLARTQLSILAGEWDRAAALAEAGLADPAQRSHGPSYFTLRAMRGLARGVLGHDVQACLEQMFEACEAFRDFRLAVSEAETSALIGRLLLKEGRFEEAREVLDRSLHVYSELGASEQQANSHSLLARTHREFGNSAAAARHARAALEIFEETGRVRRRPWSGALAARLLAEESDVAAARAFVQRFARVLDVPDLPLSQHSIHLARARIAELAGSETGVRQHLDIAHRAAAEADLRIPSPELDDELLDWAAAAARRLGLETWIAERLGPAPQNATVDIAPPFRVVTLGEFRIERNGRVTPSQAWRGAITQRLFQRLLVAEGRPLSREQIGVDFWPDASTAQARHSLRTALNKLRQTLEPGRAAGDPERWLRVEGDHLALRDEVIASWDVTRWRALLEHEDLDRRVEAIRAYTGPFAPDTLDDWALELRSDLEARFGREGRRTLRELLDVGRPDEAWEIAGCLLAVDPTDETAWSGRVRAEMARGDTASARQELARARDSLRCHLDAEPGEGLRALEGLLGVD